MTTTEQAVRWDAPDQGVWELDVSHQTGVATAAMADLMPEPYEEGFVRSFAELGLPLSHIGIAYINGRAFTSAFVHGAPRKPGNPPPDVILKILTRAVPSARKRAKQAAAARADNLPMQSVDRWQAMRPQWIDRVLALQDIDVDLLDEVHLADHIEQLAALGTEGMRIHFELINVAAAFGLFLVATDRWGLDAEHARAAVMHGVPVHREAHERLDRVVDAVGGASFDDMATLRGVSAEANAAVDDYLRHHGSWATTDDLSGLTMAEQPELLVKAVSAHRPLHETRPEPLASLRLQVPPADRDTFDQLAADAQRAHATLEDNSGLLASWPMGLLGRAMRAAAIPLAARQILPEAADVWALDTNELSRLLRDNTAIDARTVAAKADHRRHLGSLSAPRYLNGEPGPMPDPSVFPEPVAYWVEAIGAFMADKLGTDSSSGIGVQSASGRAVVAESAYEAFERIQPGDILVTRATSPAFNAIMPILGGIITSDGGPVCHAAVMARELDIPAIVGMSDAFERVPDLADIVLDPVAVSVTIN